MPTILAVLFLGGCVTKGTFELTQVQLDATRMALQARTASCHEDLTRSEDRIGFLETELAARRQDIALRDEKIAGDQKELERYRLEHAVQHQDVIPPGETVAPTVDEMVEGLSALSRQRILIQRRVDEFGELTHHLQPLIADRRLTLVHDEGRLLIRIPSDPLFNQEGQLSPFGEDLVTRLAAALADFPPRQWQIAGYTDNVPRHSAHYASNWELGFAEAVTVLRALHDAGFAPPISAASYADTVPIADNGVEEGRHTNRRLELVMLPDLSGRPGNTEIEDIENGLVPLPETPPTTPETPPIPPPAPTEGPK